MQCLIFVLILRILTLVKAETKWLETSQSPGTSNKYRFFKFDWNRDTNEDYRTKTFEVKAHSNAEMVLSPLPRIVNPMIYFIFGTEQNTKSYMYLLTDDLKPELLSGAYTPHILDADSYRNFSLVVDQGDYYVFCGSEKKPILRWRSDGRILTTPYVGVRDGVSAAWFLHDTTPCCNLRFEEECFMSLESCESPDGSLGRCDVRWRWVEEVGGCERGLWYHWCGEAYNVFYDEESCRRACSTLAVLPLTWAGPDWASGDPYECRNTSRPLPDVYQTELGNPTTKEPAS